jgi:hypothetical protein
VSKRYALVVFILIIFVVILYPKEIGNPGKCIGYLARNYSLGILGQNSNGDQYGEVIFTYYCYGIPIP